MPPGYVNPLVELVGPKECGKSTLGALAASVWAGNEDSDIGGGESWNLTLNALDDQKWRHRDNLLVLDEGNLTGASPRECREFIQPAVFKLAGTGQKRRYGDDAASQHASLAVLSTTNVPLMELVAGSPEVKGALHSRMLTVRITERRPFGVLTSVPDECQSAQDAIERLRTAINEDYGVAGRAFIERLVREASKSDGPLRSVIARALERLSRSSSGDAVGSARLQKSLALITVAGLLAKKFGVLPKAWGSLSRSVREVQSDVWSAAPVTNERSSGLARIRAYIERHRTDLIRVVDLEEPCSPEKFANAPGFLSQRADGMELLVAAARFQSEFPDFRVLMRELRDARLARTEGGAKPKLTIKAPRSICETGRVYCLVLS